jgi:hypothetical protein
LPIKREVGNLNKKLKVVANKNVLYTLMILTAAVALTLKPTVNKVYALETLAYVSPSKVVYNLANATIGTLFNVTVKVENVDDMKTWQVKMAFNDSIINVTRWYEPTSDPTYVFYGKGTLPIPYPPDVRYEHSGTNEGWVGVGAARFPAPSVGEGFTGNGLLCTIQFNVTKLPPAGENYTSAFDIEWPSDTFWIKAGETAKSSFGTYTGGNYLIIPEFSLIALSTLMIMLTIIAAIAKKRYMKI